MCCVQMSRQLITPRCTARELLEDRKQLTEDVIVREKVEKEKLQVMNLETWAMGLDRELCPAHQAKAPRFTCARALNI